MKKSWILVLLVFLVACSSSTGKEAEGTPKPNDGAAQGAQTNDKEGNSEGSKDEGKDEGKEESKDAEKDKAEQEFAVGDTFNLKDWEVVVESFEFNQSVTGGMLSSSADEGSKFLVLNLAVTNNASEAQQFIEMIGGTKIKAIYNDKYEYKISITLIDGDLANERVQPLSTAKGFTVIEMPDKVVEATEGIHVLFDIDGEKAKVKIR
ncbi:DUF4352 domain-containing protein [Paenibacillus sp. J2TS4]|uniref:DUF4352 domain-containing protein n=1 Tax=Paenibacillus sp. J2TS4 TaxID=2807194 RepID=UPI001B288B80|nr:DUF4352 domain-containing protein [Paenibacillus sp. J2TS4]GIP35059.1 hypothetical protein J2TS4_42690 [Paenibacillus sp. J2TS4]